MPERQTGDWQKIASFVMQLSRFRGMALQSCLLAGTVLLLSLPVPLLTRLIVDRALPERNYTLLLVVLLATGIVTIVYSVMNALQQVFVSIASMTIKRRMLLQFQSHILRLPQHFHDEHREGEILARAGDLRAAVSGVVVTVTDLFLNGVSLVVFAIVLGLLDWRLALVSIASLPPSAGIMALVNRKLRKLAKQAAESDESLQATVHESVRAVTTLKTMRLEGDFVERIDSGMNGVMSLGIASTLWQKAGAICERVLAAASVFGYSYIGWKMVLDDHISMGTLLAFIGFVTYLQGPLRKVVETAQSMQELLVRIERYRSIADMEEEHGGTLLPYLDLPGAGSIRLQKVRFAYACGREMFDGLTCGVDAGEHVFLMGPTGIGKSTLAKLLCGLYRPSDGCILLDGIDTRQMSLDDLRRMVCVVLQESYVFHGSVYDNIACGRGMGRTLVHQAAEAVGIVGEHSGFERGLATCTGEGGCLLSEGQRKRVLVARAVASGAPVVVLDEPSSAWDEATEIRILSRVMASMAGRTLIVISHRVESAKLASRVLHLGAPRNEAASPALWSAGAERSGGDLI